MSNDADAERVAELAQGVVTDHDPKKAPVQEYLGACYDAGLSWVHFPEGLGGLGVSRGLQAVADRTLQGAGGPVPLGLNPMGYGMAAPTIREHAQSEDVKREWLRPLATTEDLWCQLFSEPGAGSDLAGLATSAVRDGDDWVINGQKVWTSLAHRARWGLLLARTNPDVPKHKGLSYFVIDMHGAGVETRPLRQITGQAEFNEVYFTDARIPDKHRLGEVGNGWNVAMTTLMNERTALGGSGSRRGAGTIADATALWASRQDRHTPVLRDRLTQLWLRSEAQRLTSERSRAAATVGGPGPEGSIGKLVGAELNQHIYEWCMDFLGPEGLLYRGYSQGTPTGERDWQGPIQQKYLRSRANTIEGGTSEVMRNILGERILGLPGDLRADSGMPWKEIPVAEKLADQPDIKAEFQGEYKFTDEQAQLRDAVRKFSADHFAEDKIRTLMDSDPPFDPKVWARLGGELGVLGLSVPEADGGVGGTLVDQAVAIEELGARLACGPMFGTVYLAIPALVAASSGPARDELLGDLIEGRRTAAVAVVDRVGVFDPDAVSVTAEGDAVSGTVTQVVDGGIADVLLVAASGSDGVALYAVDATGSGVDRTPLATLDLTRSEANITFSKAPATLIAGPDEAQRVLDHALQVGAALLAVEQVGAAQHLLDLSVEYAKTRLQFGRPIGSFQGVKHRLANLLVDVEHARSTAYHAVWALTDGSDDAALSTSIAQAVCSAALSHVATDTIQVHGGIGFTWEHQAHLYYKRAATNAVLLGSAEEHRDRVAAMVLDSATADKVPWVADGTAV